MSPETPDIDSLGNLEERIHQTVALIANLKAERDAARTELAEARKASSETTSLRQEIEALRAERKQVRVRIEKLMAQMDQVSGQ